jgi:HEPN domain-containing protein
MSSEIGDRSGGGERLAESRLLLEREMFAGAVYLAGRAVESVLRAVIWRHDTEIKAGTKSLETGHDLRELLREIVDLGALRNANDRDELFENVQYVARLWFNNMRFLPTRKLKWLWWRQGEIGRKRDLKRAVNEYYNSCRLIVQISEALCQD